MEEQKEKSLIVKLGEELNRKGYACISQSYMNGSDTKTFLHKENMDFMQITQEDIDAEILWSYFGVEYKEIKKLVGEKLKSEDDKLITANIEDEQKEYGEVIKDLIKSNEEVIKD